jgi:hypothetical protein
LDRPTSIGQCKQEAPNRDDTGSLESFECQQVALVTSHKVICAAADSCRQQIVVRRIRRRCHLRYGVDHDCQIPDLIDDAPGFRRLDQVTHCWSPRDTPHFCDLLFATYQTEFTCLPRLVDEVGSTRRAD